LDNHNRIFHCGGRRRVGNTDAGCPTRPHQHGHQDHKHYRIGFLRDERGSVIDFLITAALSFFLIFTGVDYFTPIAQYQIAEHVMHYYLERARVEGWLTASDESELTGKFATADMTVQSISVTNQGVPLSSPLERNTDNPDASEIDLLITYKPEQQPFTIGGLIGVPAPSTYTPKVGGSVLSEYVSN
jgi:hypothetical protein